MTEVVSLPVKKDYIHQRHILCDSRMQESQSSTGKVLNYLMYKNKHLPAFFWITLFILVLKVQMQTFVSPGNPSLGQVRFRSYHLRNKAFFSYYLQETQNRAIRKCQELCNMSRPDLCHHDDYSVQSFWSHLLKDTTIPYTLKTRAPQQGGAALHANHPFALNHVNLPLRLLPCGCMLSTNVTE